MALYRLRLRTISRGRGELSLAAAAYISGTRLYLEREDWTYDFRWRPDVVHSALFGEFGWTREELWNEAEWERHRWDGVTGREILVALPHELSLAQQIELASTLAGHLVRTYGVAVDLAVHTPTPFANKDQRNAHAHLIFTASVMTPHGLGTRTRVWDDRLQAGPLELRKLRAEWRAMTNKALERAGLAERVDERSYVEQGVARIPGIHLGRVCTELERQGIPTRLGDYNRVAAWVNRVRRLLESELDWDWERVPDHITQQQVLDVDRACQAMIHRMRGMEKQAKAGDRALSRSKLREIRGTLRELGILYAALRPTMTALVKESAQRRRESRQVGKEKDGKGI